MNLARDLKLSIDYDTDSTGQWLKLRLNDDLAMTEAAIDYPLEYHDSLNKSYYLREALVISMRRLVSQAVRIGMVQNPDYHTEPASGISVDLDAGPLGI